MTIKKNTGKKKKTKQYTPAQVKKHLASGILEAKKGHMVETFQKSSPIREPLVEADAKLIKRATK